VRRLIHSVVMRTTLLSEPTATDAGRDILMAAGKVHGAYNKTGTGTTPGTRPSSGALRGLGCQGAPTEPLYLAGFAAVCSATPSIDIKKLAAFRIDTRMWRTAVLLLSFDMALTSAATCLISWRACEIDSSCWGVRDKDRS
jgi:hypothetical protein